MNQMRSQGLSRLLGSLCVLVSLTSVMVGCVASHTHRGVPDDFSLDVVILPEAGMAGTDAAQHFVVHADGSLRAGSGPQGALDHYPGQARKLSSTQMVELLGLSRQALAVAGQTKNPKPTQWLHEQPVADGETLLLWVRDSGDEAAARFDSSGDALPAVAEDLWRRLQQLALMR